MSKAKRHKPRDGESFVTFAQDVLGVRLNPAQRVLALVAFDGEQPGSFSGNDRELAYQLFGDVQTIPAAARGVLVAVCGARSGKSYVFGGLLSLWKALTADLSALAPGEIGVALIVAPDLRLARQCLRFALGAARSVPSISALIDSETSDGFVLRRPDGASVSIEALPATRGGSALRGRTLVSVVLDECSFFRDEGFVVNDAEIFRAVAPRILPGGLVVMCSTPWAESGLLFDEFTRNHEHPVTALAAHAPTVLMNPSKRKEVERETERDADNALREFGAEFMAVGSGLFFDRMAIDRALELGASVSLAAGRAGTIGGDLGLVRDASAFVSIARDGEFLDMIGLLEMRPTKGSPLKLSDVVTRAVVFAKEHSAHAIHVDHHSLAQARDLLPKGIAFEAIDGAQAAKTERFVATRTALNEGHLRIHQDFRKVANQLREVMSRPTSGGGLQITIPRRAGVHGDAAAALVVAVHAASQIVPVVNYRPRVHLGGTFENRGIGICGTDGNGPGTALDQYAAAQGWTRNY
jgi:hypothetical protein